MFGLEKTAVMAIGAGLLILALIGAIIGLINYGQKLGKAEAEVARLTAEVNEGNLWKEEALIKMKVKDDFIKTWRKIAKDMEADYNEAISRPPTEVTRWRHIAAEAPAAIPLGDCDVAATNAWDVLMRAGVIGAGTWNDSSYPSPSSLPWQEDVARLDRLLAAPSFNLYLLSSQPHHPNVSAGTYQISPYPPSPGMP
jgi:hypothetical protein